MSSSPFTIDVGQVMKACPRVLLSKVSKNGENMADIRSLNDYYTELASELIKTENALRYIFDSNVTIIYLSSQAERKSKGRITCGECEKVPEKYKWAVPADFTITIFEPNVENFSEDQIKTLLFHELLHVGILKDGDEEKYFIRPHDLEDFKLIIDRYGTEWNL